MFDKLEDLLHHYEELMNTLSEPDVANDPNRFRKLMKSRVICSQSWMPTRNTRHVSRR